MQRFLPVLAASFVIAAPALASAALPDRSTLSYEENVIINTACASAMKKASAFTDCVNHQLAELQAHPTPDRSTLSQEKNQYVESKCNYLRRSGIGEYNECLKKAIEEPPPETTVAREESATDGLITNYAQVFTQGKLEAPKEKPRPTMVADTTLAPPASVLPKRPERANGKVALSAQELFKKVERSVFVVVATASMADARTRSVAAGSAVAISDHLLLTNCHVVKNRPLIKIVQDGNVTDAKLVAGKMSLDRCVLSVEGTKLHPVTSVRSFDDLAVGEHVFAIGTPRLLERTLSEGLISSLHPRSGANIVQTSAPISPGSSGGGLFDEYGNLIGITTAQVGGQAQNLNFAIAASDFWS